MAPDLDVLIRSAGDPLLAIEYHRHFTHALLFVPAGALVPALLLWPLLRRHHAFASVYLWCFLGMLSHGLLDAATSYGTRLFWPVMPEPVSWDLISIIDPLFTGPALLLLLAGLILRQLWPGRLALACCLAYLALGLVQQQRALDLQKRVAQSRGEQALQGRVMPALGSLLVWRSVYHANGELVVDGLRPAFGEPDQLFEGGRMPRWQWPEALSPGLAHDLARFSRFTQGYTAQIDRSEGRVRLADMRYAALPQSTMSLWGLQYRSGQPDQGVLWWNDWREREASLTRLWLMTQGKDCDGKHCIEFSSNRD